MREMVCQADPRELQENSKWVVDHTDLTPAEASETLRGSADCEEILPEQALAREILFREFGIYKDALKPVTSGQPVAGSLGMLRDIFQSNVYLKCKPLPIGCLYPGDVIPEKVADDLARFYNVDILEAYKDRLSGIREGNHDFGGLLGTIAVGRCSLIDYVASRISGKPVEHSFSFYPADSFYGFEEIVGNGMSQAPRVDSVYDAQMNPRFALVLPGELSCRSEETSAKRTLALAISSTADGVPMELGQVSIGPPQHPGIPPELKGVLASPFQREEDPHLSLTIQKDFGAYDYTSGEELTADSATLASLLGVSGDTIEAGVVDVPVRDRFGDGRRTFTMRIDELTPDQRERIACISFVFGSVVNNKALSEFFGVDVSKDEQ